MLCVCSETIEKVLGERRLRLLRDLASRASEARTVEVACRDMTCAIAKQPLDVPFALIYLREPDGRSLALHGTVGLAEGTASSPLRVSLEEPGACLWPLRQAAWGETVLVEGSGIGLSLVQELVRLHGGTIDVSSAVDRGTTFTVTLPTGSAHLPPDRINGASTLTSTVGASLYTEEALRWLPGEDKGTRGQGDKERGRKELAASPRLPLTASSESPPARILLVDDNADMREYVRRLLGDRYQVEAVADGNSALDAARRQIPDLILSDVMMPGLDGFQLLRKLRADPLTKKIPIILLSARAGEESRVEGLETGADDYLIKPFSSPELLARVEGNLRLGQLRREAAYRQVSTILEGITDAFVAINCEWRYVYVNKKAEQLLQKPQAELLGKVVWEAFPELVGSPFEVGLRQAAQELVTVELVEFYHPLDTWFEVCIYPSSAGVSVYFRNVNERKQLERERANLVRELQEANVLLDTLFNNAPVGVGLWDEHLRFVRLNDALAEINGLPKEAHIGKTVAELLPGVSGDVMQALRHVVETGESIIAQEASGKTPAAPDKLRYWSVSYYPIKLSSEITWVGAICEEITDRKLAQEALRLSEDRYRSLAECLPQLVCMAGADGMMTYCNQSWIDYTGLTLEQSQVSGWQQVIHPDDLPLANRRWAEALESGNAYSLEFRLRRFDGVYRWYLKRSVPIKAEDGTIVAWLGTATDVDDQKRTEQRERFLAQASQTFAAASLDLQTVLDTITRLVSEFTSDVCVLSLLSEDGQWLDPVSFYHAQPEVQAFVSDLLSSYPRRADEGIGGRVMQTGEPLLMPVTSQQEFGAVIKPEYQLYLQRFRVRSTLIVPLKVHGRAIGVLSLTRHHPAEPHNSDDLSLFQDLADRAAMAIANARLYQQAEQARLQAEQTADRTARLQSVTAALSEPLTPAQVAEVIVEQSTAVLNACTVTVAILHENGTEIEIVHYFGNQRDVPEAFRRVPITAPIPLAEAVRTGKPLWEESTQERMARYPHLSEAYTGYNHAAWISLPMMVEGRAVGGISLSFAEFSPLSDDDRGFILALVRQCAGAIARARLYEAEQRARAAAEAANRIKDEFLAVLSHELRSPLNPILGWVKLLRTRKLDAKTVERALDTIERNAKLQTQLIEDLLDVSRILRGKLVLNVCPVNLATVIEAALETVRLAADAKGISIQMMLDPVGKVAGDSGRLQQVVWNLLSNAVKFTPSGGRVEVRLRQVDAHAQIQVQDTGGGITPEFLPYVFEYFRQADSTTTRQFGGLGLGLAIVRHLTELHGGTVQAESFGEGQGATFTVRLPLMAIAPESSESSELPAIPANLEGVQILFVDDEADMRDLGEVVLGEYGAKVRFASSAIEALSILDEFKPDVLISDIGMPEMDGYMLMREVRTRSPEQGGQIPAIALTAYAGEINRQQALAAGFQGHIAKPVEPQVLVMAISSLLKL